MEHKLVWREEHRTKRAFDAFRSGGVIPRWNKLTTASPCTFMIYLGLKKIDRIPSLHIIIKFEYYMDGEVVVFGNQFLPQMQNFLVTLEENCLQENFYTTSLPHVWLSCHIFDQILALLPHDAISQAMIQTQININSTKLHGTSF